MLVIGLPLLLALDDRERVALAAHELAHTVNGDPSRGLFIGGALRILGYVLVTFPFVGLSHLVALVFALLLQLQYRDSQRAEYLADSLAAGVGGTEATISMLEKLLLSETFFLAASRAAADRTLGSPFEEFERLMGGVPVRELERRKRIDALSDQRLDLTHPPVLYRTEFLRSRETAEPRVVLSEGEVGRLRDEIARLRRPLERRLMNLTKASLYY